MSAEFWKVARMENTVRDDFLLCSAARPRVFYIPAENSVEHLRSAVEYLGKCVPIKFVIPIFDLPVAFEKLVQLLLIDHDYTSSDCMQCNSTVLSKY